MIKIRGDESLYLDVGSLYRKMCSDETSMFVFF